MATISDQKTENKRKENGKTQKLIVAQATFVRTVLKNEPHFLQKQKMTIQSAQKKLKINKGKRENNKSNRSAGKDDNAFCTY